MAVKAERWAAGRRIGPACGAGFMVFRGVCAAAGRCGAGAAVPDGVAVLVGHGHAPGGPGVAGRRGGEVAGQVGVEGADAGHLAGPVGQAEQGDQRDGQVGPAGEPGRDHPGQRPGRAGIRGPRGPDPPSGPGHCRDWIHCRGRDRRRGRGRCRGLETAAVAWAGLPSWPGLSLVRVPRGRESMPRRMSRNARARSRSMPPSRPAWPQLPGPPGDPLISGQHLRGRQLPAGQARVPGRLRPPLHPRPLAPHAHGACFAFSGLTCITARLIADRSPAGVSDPARSRTIASAARASGGIQQHGGRRDDQRLIAGQHTGTGTPPGCRAG